MKLISLLQCQSDTISKLENTVTLGFLSATDVHGGSQAGSGGVCGGTGLPQAAHAVRNWTQRSPATPWG